MENRYCYAVLSATEQIFIMNTCICFISRFTCFTLLAVHFLREPRSVLTLIDSAGVTTYPLLLHLSAGIYLTCEIATVLCESKGAWLFKQLQILLSGFALHSCMHIRNEIPV